MLAPGAKKFAGRPDSKSVENTTVPPTAGVTINNDAINPKADRVWCFMLHAYASRGGRPYKMFPFAVSRLSGLASLRALPPLHATRESSVHESVARDGRLAGAATRGRAPRRPHQRSRLPFAGGRDSEHEGIHHPAHLRTRR